ncbi:hypothetical protein D3C87_1915050 [compost metagenome]
MRVIGEGRPEIEAEDDALQVGHVLREQVALEPVERFQRAAQFGDRFGSHRAIGAALQLADIAIHWIDRHQPRQQERDRETDEQHGEVDADAFGHEG